TCRRTSTSTSRSVSSASPSRRSRWASWVSPPSRCWFSRCSARGPGRTRWRSRSRTSRCRSSTCCSGSRCPSCSRSARPPPPRAARWLLWLPSVVMNGSARLVLRLLGWSAPAHEPVHSEDELRVILELSQSAGSLSFRQLLLMENVFDLRSVQVRDAMRLRAGVAVLRAGAPWAENLAEIRRARQTRYPLVENDGKPIGIVHLKDLVLAGPDAMEHPDLRALARPFVTVRENASLETLLGDLQRRHRHMAIVVDPRERWTGIIT